jgi:capsular polysaccharide biosynthesis protein
MSFSIWSTENQTIFTADDKEKKKKKDKKKDKSKKKKLEEAVVHEEKKAAGVIKEKEAEPEPEPEAEAEEEKEAEPPPPAKKAEPKPTYNQELSEEESNILQEMKKIFDNSGLAGVLIKWWKHLVAIAIIALLLGVLFSSPLFITPKYKSFAVVYPHNISPYSDESETEQMLQMLQSKDIKDSVILEYDLAAHYKVDSNFKYFYSTIYYEWSKSVSISKTPFESVEITVLDRDPQLACDMVNSILHFYNKKVRKTHNDKYIEVIQMYEAIIAKKQEHIDSLKLRLQVLGTEYGLFEFEAQAEEITRGYLRTVTGASSSTINSREVMRMKENIEQHGGELIEVVEALRNEAINFSLLKVDYANAVRFYTDKLSYANVVTPPYPADKKSYPVRWLIVAFTLIATVFLAIIIILILERLGYAARFRK